MSMAPASCLRPASYRVAHAEKQTNRADCPGEPGYQKARYLIDSNPVVSMMADGVSSDTDSRTRTGRPVSESLQPTNRAFDETEARYAGNSPGQRAHRPSYTKAAQAAGRARSGAVS